MMDSFLHMQIIRRSSMKSKVEKITLSIATILLVAGVISHALSGKILFFL